MNLDSLSFALSQISYSVANLTKKNYKLNINEISSVCTLTLYARAFCLIYVGLIRVSRLLISAYGQSEGCEQKA